jgi:hypothetical protein
MRWIMENLIRKQKGTLVEKAARHRLADQAGK